MKSILSAAILSAFSLVAVAEPEKKLTTDIELGVIATSGNTDSTSSKGKLNVKQELSKWRNQLLVEGLYKKDEVTLDDDTTESVTSAQKYFISAQADRKLDDKHKSLFIYGSYEDDRFSGYEYQASIAVGFSDRLFGNENSHLDYSVGPGVAFAKTEDTIDDSDTLVLGEETETLVVRVAIDYLYKFSPNAKFTQTLSSDIAADGEKNTKTKAESAITANLNSALALRASFAITNNSEVPEGIEATDTQTAISVVYSF